VERSEGPPHSRATAALEVIWNGVAHPQRLHGDGDGGYARGREERNGTEERKRRVRNEWRKRNLILIRKKLLSAMMTNGARCPPFGYVGITMP
jgi:hypothetical protein